MGSCRTWLRSGSLMAAVASASLLFACGANDNDVAPTPTPSPMPTPEPTSTPTPVKPEPEDIAIALATDAMTYAVGDAIQFTITATNVGGDEIELEFPTGQRFDIEITRDDEVVWRWSNGRVFTQAIEHVVLQAGESLEYQAPWDQLDRDDVPVEPGQYTARAVITATGIDVEATVEFEIAP